MRKLTKQLEWSWSDGWLLMALCLAQGPKGARLFELIAAADMTDHSIPTAQELSSTLTKFVRCRLVTAAGGRYLVSRRHLLALRKAYKGRGGLFSSGDKGLKWLKRAALAPQTNKRVAISEAQLCAAYDVYVSKEWPE
jgi:hypothetical protein